jgi:cell division protein FtsB
MADFSKKQKSGHWGKRIGVVVLTLSLLLLSAWLFTVDLRFYKKQHALAEAVVQQQQQVAQLQQSNNSLQEKIANYNNPEYIEKVAREDEDMQQAGEHVVSFIMPTPSTSTPKPPSPWSASYFQAKLSGAWDAIKSIF